MGGWEVGEAIACRCWTCGGGGVRAGGFDHTGANSSGGAAGTAGALAGGEVVRFVYESNTADAERASASRLERRLWRRTRRPEMDRLVADLIAREIRVKSGALPRRSRAEC